MIRFAPSPTGDFHVGNLRTALVADELAKALGIPLVVRFEDIDALRSSPEFAQRQLEALGDLGIKPDSVGFQSQNIEDHFQAFCEMLAKGLIYPCFCSRREVLEALQTAPQNSNGGELPGMEHGGEYSGKCRGLRMDFNKLLVALNTRPDGVGFRFRSSVASSGKYDFLTGRVVRNSPRGSPLENQNRNFERNSIQVLNLKSSEFKPAYNFACARDDFQLREAILVRAWDLEPAEAGQRQLRKLWSETVNAPIAIGSFFTSLVLNYDGRRLEKRHKELGWSQISKQFKSGGELRKFLLPQGPTTWQKQELAIILKKAKENSFWGENLKTQTYGIDFPNSKSPSK